MSNGGIIGPVQNPVRGDFTTTFTASGTYTSPGFGPGQADYLVVAGGGGGGNGVTAGGAGGGGGAGGYRTSFPGGTKLSIPASPISVTVGAGGAANNSGSPSIFSTITSTGGGYGGFQPTNCAGNPGGSGGGGRGCTAAGGTGNSPPTSPSQGNNGGNAAGPGCSQGAGGGGAN